MYFFQDWESNGGLITLRRKKNPRNEKILSCCFYQNSPEHLIFFPYYLSQKCRKTYQISNTNIYFIIFKNHNTKQMGAILRILSSLSELKAKVLLLGLDAAGKTTILYKLKLNQTVNSVPTIGFNVEQVKYKNLDFTVWDIGGQTRLQGLWHHYFDSSNAVIYVLDSSDLERIEEARKTMMNVIENPSLQNVPVLVFANKMDATTLKPQEILEKMGLHQLRRNWHLQPCCALNGEGLIEGFDWLSKQLSKRKK